MDHKNDFQAKIGLSKMTVEDIGLGYFPVFSEVVKEVVSC